MQCRNWNGSYSMLLVSTFSIFGLLLKLQKSKTLIYFNQSTQVIPHFNYFVFHQEKE